MAAAHPSRDIAARLRSLLSLAGPDSVEKLVRRLGVSEVALRMSIDELEPHPTFDVLAAVVREFGVDPTWLVTGTYDANTHARAIDDETRTSRTKLIQLMSGRASEDLDDVEIRREA